MLFVCACIHACMAHICVCVHVRACVYACVSVWKFITDFYNWWVFLVYTHSHRLIRVIFKSRTSLSRWQSALLRLKWWWTSKKKTVSRAAVFRWYPWTRGQFLRRSFVIVHTEHGQWQAPFIREKSAYLEEGVAEQILPKFPNSQKSRGNWTCASSVYQALFFFAHTLEPGNEANSVWVNLFPCSSSRCQCH